MKNIKVTIYTKEMGRVDLNKQEYQDFDFESVIKHRTDGPAAIEYYESGSINFEIYTINNKFHRTDGPAVIEYYEDGEVMDEVYFIDDNCYIKEDYDILINEMKVLPKSLKLTHKDWWVREL